MAGTLPNFNKTDPWSIAADIMKSQNQEIANQDYRTHQMTMATGKNMRDTAESDQKPLRRYKETSAVNQANLENAKAYEAAGLGPEGKSRYRGGAAGNVGDPKFFEEFMDTLKEQGLTNPIGLAAVAGTGQIESGWGSNVHRTWSDPSQSGQPGTSGLAMSWRDGRLKAAQDYAAANGDDPKRPSARSQASFFINEDPSLVAELQNAKDLPSAMKAINSRWKFAGYDTGGGSTGARFNAASNFLKTFGNQPLTAKERSAGVNAQPEQTKVANYDENGREYFELNMDADGFKKIRAGMPGARQNIVIDQTKPIGPRGQVVVRQYTGKEDKTKIPQPVMTPQPSIIPAPKQNTETAVVKKPMGYDGSEDM